MREACALCVITSGPNPRRSLHVVIPIDGTMPRACASTATIDNAKKKKSEICASVIRKKFNLGKTSGDCPNS